MFYKTVPAQDVTNPNLFSFYCMCHCMTCNTSSFFRTNGPTELLQHFPVPHFKNNAHNLSIAGCVFHTAVCPSLQSELSVTWHIMWTQLQSQSELSVTRHIMWTQLHSQSELSVTWHIMWTQLHSKSELSVTWHIM
jgi:hypothetical protein